MFSRFLRRGVVMLAGVAAAVMMFAAPLHADINGPQAFYFTATCTGIGDVLLVNTGTARTAAVQVVGTTTVVLVGSEPSGSPGVQKLASNTGTSCTFTGFGPSPDQIQPLDPPQTVPAVIVNG
jgi:hypothetical protein